MSETPLTKEIKRALYRYTGAHGLGVYGCFEAVTGSTAGYGEEHVDFMTMDAQDIFRCYEIKVSKEDLYSKAELSFYGDYNYLVVPEELAVEAGVVLWEKFGGGYKPGILLYHPPVSGFSEARFSVLRSPKRQNVRIDQRIANMHNMVRSMSRYVTNDWKEEGK